MNSFKRVMLLAMMSSSLFAMGFELDDVVSKTSTQLAKEYTIAELHHLWMMIDDSGDGMNVSREDQKLIDKIERAIQLRQSSGLS